MRTRIVIFCRASSRHWYEGVETARCDDQTHDHQTFHVHIHRDPVTLPDGSRVTAVSFDPGDPNERDVRPDFGLYLDARWQPPWTHVHLDWPDFGVPSDIPAVLHALIDLLDRARAGQAVEIGCLGGHGRTGTALAMLAVLTGIPAGEAVAWTRANYCAAAVETTDQEALVITAGRHV